MQKGVSCLGKRGEKLPPVPRGNRGVCARKQETEVQSCLEYICSSLLGSASEPGAHLYQCPQAWQGLALQGYKNTLDLHTTL